MPFQAANKKLLLTFGKMLLTAFLVGTAVFSGRLAGFVSLGGMIFLIMGEIALILMGFSLHEIAAAFRHAIGRSEDFDELHRSVYFWESAARNALILGVLATQISFVVLLCSLDGPGFLIEAFGDTLLPTLYGLILAIVFGIPALLLQDRIESGVSQPEASTQASPPITAETGLKVENWIGYGVWAVLIFVAMPGPSAGSQYSPLQWLIHWPALLVVVGGALILALFFGRLSGGRSLTLSFAFSGILGALIGLIQTSHGFAQTSISAIAGALSFSISSCFVALMAMLFVGIPMEDRAQRRQRNRGKSILSRVSWYGLPMATLLVLILTAVFVVTPIKK